MEARLTQASNKQLSKLIVSNLAGTLGSAILTFVIGLIILKHSDSAIYFGLSQASRASGFPATAALYR